MIKILRRGCLLSLTCAAMGCSSATTQTPDLFRGQLPREHAATQRQGFEMYDPLPSDAGPFTDTRPRAYNQQRSMPRRAKDNYYPPGGYLPSNGAVPQSSRPDDFSGTVDTN
ncbi:hypothetical protein CA54_56020 [Symmachiella macrocystis]|uniref:Lipoprotein n=1 Tax=Symmachiella macrocystis TaxID=2527985 RepID=A0A5C6B607_9PLAN|nr:hypothetical protein [Symmachiella macrocystis]TWU07197.1 hypothetical protein CA54_56020 [Symmachiella macrocystis]